MLQIPYLRDHREIAIKALNTKKVPDAAQALDTLFKLDDERRRVLTLYEQNQATLNLQAKAVGLAMKNGQVQEAEQIKAEVVILKEQTAELDVQVQALQEEIHQQLVRLPNLPHHSVPEGNGPADNEVVFLSDPNAEQI